MTRQTVSTRWWVGALVGIVASLGLVACSDAGNETRRPNKEPPNEPTGAEAQVLDGRIAFVRGNPSDGEAVTYTVNADGSHEKQLYTDGPSEGPGWAPLGTEIQISCCDDGNPAHFVDPDTGDPCGLCRSRAPLGPAEVIAPAPDRA